MDKIKESCDKLINTLMNNIDALELIDYEDRRLDRQPNQFLQGKLIAYRRSLELVKNHSNFIQGKEV
jgi:hypothetical protein